jgi:hypothetical protein
MDILIENADGGSKKNRRWVFAGYVEKGVQAAFVLSFIVFAMYLVGSIPDPGFSDYLLFVLLRLLRYLSLLLCAFSLFAMGFSVNRLVHFPRLRHVLGLLFYFVTSMLGAFFSMLDSFMVVATGGNV